MLENLRALRENAGISQKQLADAIGVSQQSINKYENHNIEPDIETMIRIADYFDTSVDYLIGHSNVRRKIENTTKCELNKQEFSVIEQFRLLSAKQKNCILTLLDSYRS